MFTQQHYQFFAKFLGSHVIPELLTTRDLNGGALRWSIPSTEGFYRNTQWLLREFKRDNPNFKLERFNKKMLEHAEAEFTAWGTHWMIMDLPGVEILEEGKGPNWTFRPPKVKSYGVQY